MFFLYVYLGIGVLALLIIFIAHKVSTPWESSLNEILTSLDPQKQKLSYKIINHLLVPCIAAILIVLAWPITIYMKYSGYKTSEEPSVDMEENNEFKVVKSDLIAKFTREEVEFNEMVYDPLGAVPKVSFGHLNLNWKKFIQNIQPEDTIWSFRSKWKNKYGFEDIKQGYVLVRENELLSYFLTP